MAIAAGMTAAAFALLVPRRRHPSDPKARPARGLASGSGDMDQCLGRPGDHEDAQGACAVARPDRPRRCYTRAAAQACPWRRPSSGCGVFTQVADQADHVLGDEPADGAAGVHADHDLAGRVEDEPGGLQEAPAGVDERAGEPGDGPGVGVVPDREGQAVLGDQPGGGGLVVYRQRRDLSPGVGEAATGTLEGPQLRVAVRAPRPARPNRTA